MTHGSVTIQAERCKACGFCLQACPQHVLRLSDALNLHGYHPVILDESDKICTGCGVCAVVCPDVVFTVYRTPARQRHAA
jgi:2-oxoglutarate ferredoxin oxidoreductase subunit delta